MTLDVKGTMAVSKYCKYQNFHTSHKKKKFYQTSLAKHKVRMCNDSDS